MAEKNTQPLTKIVLSKEEIEASKLAAQYREVFGEDGSRNSSQLAVWNDIVSKTFAKSSIYVPGRDGKIDPLNAAICSGRRDVYLHIEQRLHFELETQQNSQKLKR
jgi:hypothetical protein